MYIARYIIYLQYLSMDQVRITLYQLLLGVRYIHSAGVHSISLYHAQFMHRDLKTGNILINKNADLAVGSLHDIIYGRYATLVFLVLMKVTSRRMLPLAITELPSSLPIIRYILFLLLIQRNTIIKSIFGLSVLYQRKC